ncbi:hypothetical protein GCM10019016_044170 [Streptomyces prasinosporus]|uniref:Uncharacterized protein n=1 Tax=Streptomyces prasinosporus TaxID=68256 RepID=A0ABP6TPT9_9ACTN
MSLGDDTGRTRTRLPEGDGDLYGGARRGGRSSSRGLVTAVGVVVLLIAAIAFANRGGDDSASADDSGDSPRAAATAPSGEKPVKAKSAGIPSGFAHDRQGAESAAANYAVVLGSAEMFDRNRRREIVTTVYAPDVAAARQADLDKAYSNGEFLANIGPRQGWQGARRADLRLTGDPRGHQGDGIRLERRHRRGLVHITVRSVRRGLDQPGDRKLVHHHLPAEVDR